MNPYVQTIENIRQRIAAEQEALLVAQRSLAAQQDRLANWLRNYRGPGHSPEADMAIQDANRWIATHQAEVAAAQSNLDSLNQELLAALKASEDYDNALAQATREGLTGDAAVKRAEGIVAQKKALYWGLAIGAIILLIALAIWFFRKNA